MSLELGGSGPPPLEGVTLAWGVWTPPLEGVTLAWGVCDNRLDPPARTPGSFRETFGHWSYANRSFLHVRGCAGMNSSWMRWLGITAVNHIDHSRMYERLAQRAGCGDRACASAHFVTRLAQRAGCGDCARASARFHVTYLRRSCAATALHIHGVG